MKTQMKVFSIYMVIFLLISLISPSVTFAAPTLESQIKTLIERIGEVTRDLNEYRRRLSLSQQHVATLEQMLPTLTGKARADALQRLIEEKASVVKWSDLVEYTKAQLKPLKRLLWKLQAKLWFQNRKISVANGAVKCKAAAANTWGWIKAKGTSIRKWGGPAGKILIVYEFSKKLSEASEVDETIVTCYRFSLTSQILEPLEGMLGQLSVELMVKPMEKIKKQLETETRYLPIIVVADEDDDEDWEEDINTDEIEFNVESNSMPRLPTQRNLRPKPIYTSPPAISMPSFQQIYAPAIPPTLTAPAPSMPSLQPVMTPPMPSPTPITGTTFPAVPPASNRRWQRVESGGLLDSLMKTFKILFRPLF